MNTIKSDVAAPASKPASSPSGMRFWLRISLHISILILITGMTLTAVMVFQYRHRIAKMELEASYLSYNAAYHMILAHYKIHTNQFNQAALTHTLTSQLSAVEENGHAVFSHRPVALVLRAPNLNVLFEFGLDEQTLAPLRAPPTEISMMTRIKHDLKNNLFTAAGPLTFDGKILGMVQMAFPSRIDRGIRALLKKSNLIMIVIIFAAIMATFLFTRHLLAPIEMLTKAAARVHEGDLDQQVPVNSDDEIGKLCATFNEMIESMSRRISLMRAMQEWTIRLSRRLYRTRIINMLSEMFTHMIRAKAYRLYLYDTRSGELLVSLERGGEELPSAQDDSLSHNALMEQWTQYIDIDGNVTTEQNNVKELAIPMLSGKDRIGVIRIGPPARRVCYDNEMLSTLQTLAQQASVAIDNANMYDQLAEKERIEQEIQLARKIQTTMHPKETPSLTNYSLYGGSNSAYEVGGDYFDYILTGKDQCSCIIADVSGKGVPAALIMSTVRALFHTYLEFEQSPQKILRRMNRNISRDLEQETFVTVTAMNLDCTKHEIRVSRAGHEPVIIIPEEGEIKYLSPRGPAVGLLEIEMFDDLIEEQTFTIKPGDTVVLFTDGITEALNPKSDEFGIERLERILSENRKLGVKGLYQKIISETMAFAGHRPQSDDQTLIILRRSSSTTSDGSTMRVERQHRV